MDTTYVDKINYVANWNKITLVMSDGHQIGIPLDYSKIIFILDDVGIISP